MEVTNKQRLVYCKDCRSRESWQRYPERDVKVVHDTEIGTVDNASDTVIKLQEARPCPCLANIFEFCYRCRICGALTWYPYQPFLNIDKRLEPELKTSTLVAVSKLVAATKQRHSALTG